MTYHYTNMLQVWHVTSEPLDTSNNNNNNNNDDDGEEEAEQDIITNLLTSPSSTTTATHKESVQLSYIIAFPSRGAMSKLAWLPNKFLPAPAHTSVPVWEQLLGVVAVVCGDGTCLVLLLPKASAVTLPRSVTTAAGVSSGTSSATTGDRGNGSIGEVVDIPVLLEASVCKWEISMRGKSPSLSILSATWSPAAPWHLLCGMSDGSVTLWDLLHHMDLTTPPTTFTTTAPHSPSTEHTTTHTIPLTQPTLRYIDPAVDPINRCVSAVKALAFNPYQPNLFASVGYEGVIKVRWSSYICICIVIYMICCVYSLCILYCSRYNIHVLYLFIQTPHIYSVYIFCTLYTYICIGVECAPHPPPRLHPPALPSLGVAHGRGLRAVWARAADMRVRWRAGIYVLYTCLICLLYVYAIYVYRVLCVCFYLSYKHCLILYFIYIMLYFIHLFTLTILTPTYIRTCPYSYIYIHTSIYTSIYHIYIYTYTGILRSDVG